MIYLEVTGRCGNQLFQYAFARKLSLVNDNQPIHINFYNVERWRLKTKDDSFSDQLRFLNTKEYTSSLDKSNWLNESASKRQISIYNLYQLIRKIAYRTRCKSLYRFGLHLLNRSGIYREDESSHNIIARTKESDLFAKGYFENAHYFDDIRDILLEEFTPKFPIQEKNKSLYDIMENRESVCVSFRRWSEVSEEVSKERDICNKAYYEKAIEKMHQIYPDAVFIVFSNDVEWVKNNFEFKYETIFEDGTDEVWEKLRLMYSCKHFIMATSTFTWWAQYLSRNPQKVVISPDRWYNDVNKECYLIQEDWIKKGENYNEMS